MIPMLPSSCLFVDVIRALHCTWRSQRSAAVEELILGIGVSTRIEIRTDSRRFLVRIARLLLLWGSEAAFGACNPVAGITPCDSVFKEASVEGEVRNYALLQNRADVFC